MSSDNWEGDRDLDEYKGQDWKGSVFGRKYGHDEKYRGVDDYGGSPNSNNYGGGYSRENDTSHGKRNGAIILLVIGLIVVGALFVNDVDLSSVPQEIDEKINDVDLSSIPQEIDEKVWKSGDSLKSTFNSFDSNHITISYDPIPDYSNDYYVRNSISDAVQQWTDKNPDMTIQLVESNGDVQIEWKKVIFAGHTGLMEGSIMDVELGSLDCNNNWNQYSMFSISDTISHELGHYLKLGHSIDPTHLMYGDDEFTQIPFDNLGYNIPDNHLDFQSWIGYDVIENEYNDLNRDYIKLDREYIKLDRDYIKLDREYSQYPEIISSELQYQKAMQLYNQLSQLSIEMNVLADEMNVLVDEMNVLADEMNCLSNQ